MFDNEKDISFVSEKVKIILFILFFFQKPESYELCKKQTNRDIGICPCVKKKSWNKAALLKMMILCVVLHH